MCLNRFFQVAVKYNTTGKLPTEGEDDDDEEQTERDSAVEVGHDLTQLDVVDDDVLLQFDNHESVKETTTFSGDLLG